VPSPLGVQTQGAELAHAGLGSLPLSGSVRNFV